MSSVVTTDVCDGIGYVTINRPEVLNALNHDVVLAMRDCLRKWEAHDGVHLVIVQGAGPKAFCAGGDIKSIYQARNDTNTWMGMRQSFYRDEYGLNHYIASYKKPYISLCDGICMGGGMGVAVAGPYRVSTERSLWAMPETAIGFFPDVGAGYFLNKCPGFIGCFLGLTGYRMHTSDLIYTGLATHYIPSHRLHLLQETLARSKTEERPQEVLEAVLDHYTRDVVVPSPLQRIRAGIDRCFAYDTIENIMEALEREEGEWAAKAFTSMSQASPISLKVTRAHFKHTKNMRLEQVLDEDFKLSQKFMAHPDFFEGVRALLVDKDKKPRWKPYNVRDVTIEMVDDYLR